MMDSRCSYCLTATATTEDHVVAGQFFPPDQRWRGNLPKVPACFSCNQEKSRAEDIAGVVLQFGDASPGSKAVLNDRVPRTLARNLRLLKELQLGFRREVIVRHEDGTRQRAMVIELDDRHLRALEAWHRFVVRGLYRHETGGREVRFPLTMRFIWSSRC